MTDKPVPYLMRGIQKGLKSLDSGSPPAFAGVARNDILNAMSNKKKNEEDVAPVSRLDNVAISLYFFYISLLLSSKPDKGKNVHVLILLYSTFDVGRSMFNVHLLRVF
jgi:hypothetical protein